MSIQNSTKKIQEQNWLIKNKYYHNSQIKDIKLFYKSDILMNHVAFIQKPKY